ncbi:hypothetical protein F5Y18DRAFT_378144 [Xylariaceae sp. FL1019]|nr:hypothetical protein F5Y18DRAFT_378144 [Xylariaceae sp. FL1019]
MAPLSTTVGVAAAASIVASGWSSGMGFGLSFFGIPTILNGHTSSEVMIRQWRYQFLRGQAIMPGLAALNAVNFWAVAYHCYSHGLEWRGFAEAGASVFFIIPFTLMFIMDTNKQLLAEHDSKVKSMGEGTVKSLIQKWGYLNVVRAVVPLLGTVPALGNLALYCM